MKATVNPDLCIGCGICSDACPEVFELSGDIAIVIVATIPPEVEERCTAAMETCPVDAIRLED